MKQVCTIQKRTDFSAHDFSCLFLLYAPLIGQDAIHLYGLLRSISGDVEVDQIQRWIGFGGLRLTKARKMLEQFELLKTYYNRELQSWIYEIHTPLASQDFLRHDTFSRLYLQQVGSRQFDEIKVLLEEKESIPIGFENVSESVNVSPLDQWDEQKEIVYSQVRPQKASIVEKSNFDFDTFLKGMDNIFPIGLRTEQTLSTIAQLSMLHGITAKEMKKYVMRSINPETMEFDEQKLREFVFANRRVEKVPKNKYDMAPIKFMQNAQQGAPVAYADKKLIESLSTQFGLENEVINVLIEYTLQQTNQKFPKAYVQKVAASWARLQISDVKSALEQTKEETKPQKKKDNNPEWYQDKKVAPASQELIQQAMAMQNKGKGETDGKTNH